ncbi:hypothetical protein ACFY4C_35780 [Actinomadura viridis]|uniref:hypothetical protein n=1 Tax=Actinomadura viridis TaxID=58110 RepID=UPI0036CD65F4
MVTIGRVEEALPTNLAAAWWSAARLTSESADQVDPERSQTAKTEPDLAQDQVHRADTW